MTQSCLENDQQARVRAINHLTYNEQNPFHPEIPDGIGHLSAMQYEAEMRKEESRMMQPLSKSILDSRFARGLADKREMRWEPKEERLPKYINPEDQPAPVAADLSPNKT